MDSNRERCVPYNDGKIKSKANKQSIYLSYRLYLFEMKGKKK